MGRPGTPPGLSAHNPIGNVGRARRRYCGMRTQLARQASLRRRHCRVTCGPAEQYEGARKLGSLKVKFGTSVPLVALHLYTHDRAVLGGTLRFEPSDHAGARWSTRARWCTLRCNGATRAYRWLGPSTAQSSGRLVLIGNDNQAPVAQWKEQRTSNPTARGSNPFGGAVTPGPKGQSDQYAERAEFDMLGLGAQTALPLRYSCSTREVTARRLLAIERMTSIANMGFSRRTWRKVIRVSTARFPFVVAYALARRGSSSSSEVRPKTWPAW